MNRGPTSLTDEKLNHRIDMLSLAITYVSLFSCLIRSDYNLVLALFAYFVWQLRKDLISLKIILATLIMLLVFDFIFIFTECRVWVSDDPGNNIWGTLRPMHNFGIFCLALINILKILLTVFVIKGLRDNDKAVQLR